MLTAADLVARVRAGYGFTEASALEQVAKAAVPVLFIHGSEDNFVYTDMVYDLYDACRTPKDLLVVEGAGHGESYAMDPALYFDTVFGFIEGTAICLVGGLIGTLAVTALVRTFGMRVVRAFFSEEKLASISWLRDSKRFELIMFIVFLIPGTPKDVLTYAAGISTCPWWRIAAITTVGRIPSIATSTLAAGFASEGSWVAAGATLIVTGVIVAGGAVAYRAISRRASC